jgi:sugar transferase (PEP-CTERM/EpsH1 system associated)
MQDILFLSHRIPYPPDKGDKVRSWNILNHLASRHRVHLATFVDDPDDLRHVPYLKSRCASVFCQQLSPRLAKLRSLRGLISGASLTEGYFGDARFAAAVDNIVARSRATVVYVFSSAMAPYADSCRARVILDLVDVDSEKWRQYGEAHWGLGRLAYSREARALSALERRAAAKADAVILISAAEARLFTNLAPELSNKVHTIGNGVDIDYFDPSIRLASPFGERTGVVFTGVMNYRPNIEAMNWFTGHVMPLLRGQSWSPHLWIVGSSPSRSVRSLVTSDVHVTGRVPDIRPYLQHARAAIAPLRIARGVQNKALEAMAMAVPLVVTPQVRQTLDHCRDEELMTASTPEDFAAALRYLLRDRSAQTGVLARKRVIDDYRWSSNLAKLDRLIDAAPSTCTIDGGQNTAAQPVLA